MYERALTLGADLTIANTSSGGTKVALTVPSSVAYRKQDGHSPSQLVNRYLGFIALSTRPVRRDPAIDLESHTDKL